MTDEDFRALVLEAFKVLPIGDYHYPFAPNQLRCLVDRAVEAEREACARVCEPQDRWDDPLTAWSIAQAIRARGSK